jgi:feruloyl-CoA synthase
MAGSARDLRQIPFKSLGMRGADIDVERRSDGSFIITSRHPPAFAPASIPLLLAQKASQHPERAFLKERPADGGAWNVLTYGETAKRAEGIAQALIDRDLGPGDAVLIISGNSIEHAALTLGCMTAGVTAVPVSPSYALLPQGWPRLLHCARIVRPAIAFAQSVHEFAGGITALRGEWPDLEIVSAHGDSGTRAIADLWNTTPGPEVARRRDALGPETVAKVLFTSGSTGLPKGVPQTQGMMTAVIAGTGGLRNEELAPGQIVQFLDWMPWSHIAAGNINFNGVLHEGGTLHLDDGRPIAGRFDATIRNLREVSPIYFASAPIAFAMLADALEADAALRQGFFRNLRYMAYGGATLSDDLYDRLQLLAVAETGYRIPITTMYGSTETQGITMTHWATERVGMIGLPLPGIALKLVPNGLKLEVRVKGPTVMTGYLDNPEQSAAAFDEEGYYRLGDAVRFLDDGDLAQGLVFDGRVAEDFKLASGTWVSVGVLRPDIVAACSPYLQDAVIAGQDRACVAALLWPSAAALETFARDGDLDAAALVEILSERLAAHNAGASGSSRRVGRFLIATEPLSLAAGEITDKGYVNQRAVLDRRADDIAQLYREPIAPGVTVVP